MEKVPWNRVILDEFCDLAILSPLEENIIRTRAAGWSRVEQCHAYGISLATLDRIIKKLKKSYHSVEKYSELLPPNIDF